MNVLDALLFGVRNIFYAGSAMPTRSAVNVHGAGVVVTDDVANERTDIEIPGSGPGAGLTLTAVKTANYTAAIGELVRVDASGGAVTIDAPIAVGHTDERWGVVRVDSPPATHAVTLAADDTINDDATYLMPLARQAVTMRSDGSTWRVESEFLDVTVSDATPSGVSTSGSAGTSSALARGDHVHALTYAVVQSAIGGASSALGLNAQRITGVADPVSDQDAATKAYVDANAGGTSWRVAPDAHDLGVWTMEESSGAFANTGADGALDLVPSAGWTAVDYARSGQLVTCVSPPSLDAYIASANSPSGCQPAGALTVWSWILLTRESNRYAMAIGKLHAASGWAGPYYDYALDVMPTGSYGHWRALINIGGAVDGLKTLELGGTSGTSTSNGSSFTLGVPHLLGLTHDGTTLKAYFDGALAGSMSAVGSIGYGTGPIVRAGVTPATGAGGFGLYGLLGEARVADTVRSAAYFREVYQSFMRRWP